VDRVVGINIDSKMDTKGLDEIEHGETAINLLEYNKNEYDDYDQSTYFLNLVSQGDLTEIKQYYKAKVVID